MLIGYMRVSKSDGSQTLDLQRDALLAAGVAAERLYEDRASGRQDDRPGLTACLKALQPGNTLVVWQLGRVDELFDDNPHGNEMNQSQKGLAQFLIPRGNASKLLEVVEETFNLLT